MTLDIARRRAFVACPFNMLVEQYFDRLIELEINPEIGLNGSIMADYSFSDFHRAAKRLEKAGRRCSIHGPFIDIFPGAFDPVIRQVCVSRLQDAVDLAVVFGAEHVVIHAGFEEKMFGEVRDRWLANFLDSISRLLDHAMRAGVKIMLENTFEKDTSLHERIFAEIQSEHFGFCLDIGHVMAFSNTPLDEWLAAVGKRIGHLHLHDNQGQRDDHLAIGEGQGDFETLFSFLLHHGIDPIMTVEVHDAERVIPSLEALGRLLERYPV